MPHCHLHGDHREIVDYFYQLSIMIFVVISPSKD